jgi:phosphoribosyl 1,2-cyclic phosphodiesterase
MRAWTLGSGSRGNAILLEAGSTRVLVDAGYPPRALARRLAAIQVAPESIQAVIVTHEHIDHARGVAAAQARWHWRVYGTAGTLAGIPELDAGSAHRIHDAPFTVGELTLQLVRVPHDAAAPAAVLATAQASGFRTGCAHDLGSVPDSLRRAFRELDLLLLESNHDDAMLRRGPYPPFLQQRIAGRSGHLSNAQSAALVRELAGPGLRELVLLHLSEVNNTPRHAVEAARAALNGARAPRTVTAAPQDTVAGPFGAARGASAAAQQLRLAL